ncbi:hypothetical protein D3C78_1342510 [compost metagenome]
MQDIPAKSQFFQYARAKVFDQDVGFAEQLLEDRQAVRVLEVQGEGLLVARLHEPPQRGALVEFAPLAQRVTAVRGLDLGHIGAELGANARSERSGNQGAEFDDFQAGKRFGGERHG